MQKVEELIHGNYYHIYNRGINSCDLFREKENYEYFLWLYDRHILPLADTYAWVLMPNHFHFLVKIRDIDLSGLEAGRAIQTRTTDPDLSGLKKKLTGLKPPHQYFSNLFNAYTKAVNKRYGRHGSLFERPFKRIKIDSIEYLKQALLYIHNNPVHHGFCQHPSEYPWSSYKTCISIKPTKLQREVVIGWFDSEANFVNSHNGKVETKWIEKWLDL
ncbi:MAG: hypothetical protein K9H62_19750 [Bacteroidales bacterium]|nr:hypothetical protein [Bacteroidales bacterium]